MSNDEAEKERDFLASLKSDSGRELGEWMSAIDASAADERNDIIDWLRRQGFTFAKASWLERIHHNNGRPIYLEDGLVTAVTNAATAKTTAGKPNLVVVSDSSAIAPTNLDNTPTNAANENQPAETALAALPAPDPDQLEKLLQSAKAYRPLAQFLVREIATAVPSATQHPSGSEITFANPNPFAVLVVSPKALRLALSLGDTPVEPPLEPAKFPQASVRVSAQISQNLTHIAVLTDARQVNDVLIGQITRAAAL